MSWEVTSEALELSFRDPFRIARSMDSAVAHTVITHLSNDDDRSEGRRRHGRGIRRGVLRRNERNRPGGPAAARRAARAIAMDLRGDRKTATKALEVVSAAMDRDDRPPRRGEGRHRHRPARPRRQAAGPPRVRAARPVAYLPPTDFTIGIDEPEVVAERARSARRSSRRSRSSSAAQGRPRDARSGTRGLFSGPIRVDANTGWEPEAGARLIPELVRLGVELIEQPFPAHRLDQLRWLQERSSLPIVADESAVTIDDLAGPRRRLRGRQREARQVRRRRAGQADAGTGEGARLQDVPRVHGGDHGRHRRVGRRRVAGGLGRPRREPAPRPRIPTRAWCSTTTAAGTSRATPGWGSGCAAEPGHRLPTRVFHIGVNGAPEAVHNLWMVHPHRPNP